MNTFVREYLNKEEKYLEIIHTGVDYAYRRNSILSRNSGGDNLGINIYDKTNKTDKEKVKKDWKAESVRRAKKLLKFLILNNVNSQWRFVTLTYAGEGKHNKANAVRDIQKMIERLEKYLCRDVKYIAVKELHKTGHGIHFHILMNIPYFKNEFFQKKFWKKGFVKIEKLKKTLKNFTLIGVFRYLKKYMTKDSDDTEKYEKRFFSSRNLIREPRKIVKQMNEDDFVHFLQGITKMKAHQIEAWQIEDENGNLIEGHLFLLPKKRKENARIIKEIKNFDKIFSFDLAFSFDSWQA